MPGEVALSEIHGDPEEGGELGGSQPLNTVQIDPSLWAPSKHAAKPAPVYPGGAGERRDREAPCETSGLDTGADAHSP